MSVPLLEVRGLEVVFDGFRAIDGVDFTVNEGELRFLIGPNGAGKTTLVDVVTGLTKPAGGSVSWNGGQLNSVTGSGIELIGMREFDIVRLGIGRTFQTAFVFEQLSVIDNLDLAATYRTRSRSLLRRRRHVDARITDTLETIGLMDLAERPAAVLSHGQRQWLEIGMLLVQDHQLLLLDEPVAGMSKSERRRTGELLQQIAKDRTVVVIEHDMDFLRDFASVVTVLHEGRLLCEGSVGEVQSDPRVQEVYLGRNKSPAAAEAV
ncbi:MAG: urea ABC transporter ATP-binding protein UrtD [Acidimicrobiales bacterium]